MGLRKAPTLERMVHNTSFVAAEPSAFEFLEPLIYSSKGFIKLNVIINASSHFYFVKSWLFINTSHINVIELTITKWSVR